MDGGRRLIVAGLQGPPLSLDGLSAPHTGPTELTPGGVRHWDGAGQWPETGRSARIADRAARPSLLGLLTNIGDRQSIGTSGMRRRLSILTPFCSQHAGRHVDPSGGYSS